LKIVASSRKPALHVAQVHYALFFTKSCCVPLGFPKAFRGRSIER
jgi:hypothetical protein